MKNKRKNLIRWKKLCVILIGGEVAKKLKQTIKKQSLLQGSRAKPIHLVLKLKNK